jgi:energy-converting hydrogenase B subunit D
MPVVQGVALILVVIIATTVVFVRDPKRQIFIYMIYGLAMTVLLAAMQAPDVALSELAVGSVAVPFAVLATLVRIEHGKRQ